MNTPQVTPCCSLGSRHSGRLLILFAFVCMALSPSTPVVFESALVPAASAESRLRRIEDPLGENRPYSIISATVPAPGDSVLDDRLGTVQTRVTTKTGLRHEYARFSPFNADCSRILLLDTAEGQWTVYSTANKPYDKDASLIRVIEGEEPRWDTEAPGTIWATQDFRILKIDVDSGRSEVVKDFRADARISPILKSEPDLYRITMKDEGEASTDRRYWAFILQGVNDDYRARYLLVWDKQDDRVLGLRPLALAESRIDWVGMSPRGSWVLIGCDHDNGGALPGFVMADRSLEHIHPLHYSTGHADVGFDSEGNEVIVMQNAQTDYIDMIPLTTETKPIPPGGEYAGSGHVPLVRLSYASDSPTGLQSGMHISCNFPGWCVVSTHIEAGLKEQNWLDRSIILVRLDKKSPAAYYLSKVYGACNTYWEETHGTISSDGSRVVWATNWGTDPGQGAVWLMELQLPAGWSDTLK